MPPENSSPGFGLSPARVRSRKCTIAGRDARCRSVRLGSISESQMRSAAFIKSLRDALRRNYATRAAIRQLSTLLNLYQRRHVARLGASVCVHCRRTFLAPLQAGYGCWWMLSGRFGAPLISRSTLHIFSCERAPHWLMLSFSVLWLVYWFVISSTLGSMLDFIITNSEDTWVANWMWPDFTTCCYRRGWKNCKQNGFHPSLLKFNLVWFI